MLRVSAQTFILNLIFTYSTALWTPGCLTNRYLNSTWLELSSSSDPQQQSTPSTNLLSLSPSLSQLMSILSFSLFSQKFWSPPWFPHFTLRPVHEQLLLALSSKYIHKHPLITSPVQSLKKVKINASSEFWNLNTVCTTSVLLKLLTVDR